MFSPEIETVVVAPKRFADADERAVWATRHLRGWRRKWHRLATAVRWWVYWRWAKKQMETLSIEEKDNAYQDGIRAGRREMMILVETCARSGGIVEEQIRATAEYFVAKLNEYDSLDEVKEDAQA